MDFIDPVSKHKHNGWDETNVSDDVKSVVKPVRSDRADRTKSLMADLIDYHRRLHLPHPVAVMSTVEKINSTENPTFPHILSHATKVPGLIFLSGQTPVGKDGKVVQGGIKV